MPTLNWIGKDAVVNHHHQVPFHLLKDVPELAGGDTKASICLPMQEPSVRLAQFGKVAATANVYSSCQKGMIWRQSGRR
jgi:hypothetical protein